MKTVQIPGGTVTFRSERSEMKQRHLVKAQLAGAKLGPVLNAVLTASVISVCGAIMEDRSQQKDPKTGELLFTGQPVDLSDTQLELLYAFGQATTWGLIDSWSFDEPVPDSPDGLLDLPADVYEALTSEAAKINATLGGGAFDVDEAMDTREENGEIDKSTPTGA